MEELLLSSTECT